MSKESFEINGIHWDVSGSCVDFQATSIAVGGEQFLGSRGSRPLGIRSAMKRTYEENVSFYTVAGFLMLSLLLVVAVLLIVALSLSFLLLRNS